MHLQPRPNKSRGTSGLRMTSLIVNEMVKFRTRDQYQAQSILTGIQFRDNSSTCPPLTDAQAADVLQWARHYVVM